MGTIVLVLSIFVGQFIAVQSVIKEQDAMFSQEFPGFIENTVPFPFKRHFDLAPYETVFSSWQTRTPDFHMLAGLPPITNVPKIDVFCDEFTLTLLVDKSSIGVILTGEEMQLGDSCYSNRELPNQFVFTYSLDECGTEHVMQNGLDMFTNSLYLNLKSPPTWWQIPSTVHISCIPKRCIYFVKHFVQIIQSPPPPASWTSTAESNIYKRGQVVNLQVSAITSPKEQLFIQSCYVSVSPEPRTRPRHAVILNKGCTVPFSSHAVVQFVASNRADVVNFVLNTSCLNSEIYIHCSVLVSDQSVRFGSKSCNYNTIQSRWDDLSGTEEVCDCCSSKCKGLSVKHLSEDAKAIVSTGPLVIVDKDVKCPEPPVSGPQTSSALELMQSDGAATEEEIVSGTLSKFSPPPEGVVVAREDPVARLTLWLPGQVQDAEHSESEDHLKAQLQASNTVSNDLPELQPSTADLNNKMGDQSANELSDAHMFLNLLTLTGSVIPHLEKVAIEEESQRKLWFGRSGISRTKALQEVDTILPTEMTVNVQNQNDFNQMTDEAAPRPQEETIDAQPIIRSKLQFSKSSDGSQTLSYEEQQGGKSVVRCGMDGIKRQQEPRQRGLFSAFLDLLRRMDKVE
ncbi:zona pellucida protein C isoform X2 [Micropterus dolomieu]|uniref:zona pellucida protein C isoform X2 n=1 Tax=Micropterus dolomieu TaxID=147949 RepID=UPI001E8E8A86|nr:zona pellucida protein C isoform X2 [Micropterus dolomieu]